MSDIDEREEVYCFDIDGCLGEEKIGDCLNAKPNNRRISEVNSLYRKGATIYLMTSRGMVSNNNNQVKADKEMRTATEKQLKEWGVEYHQLSVSYSLTDQTKKSIHENHIKICKEYLKNQN